MGDVPFSYQLAELEQVSKLRTQYGTTCAVSGNKYNNYNTIYRTNGNPNQVKSRRANSGGDSGMAYNTGNRRQRQQQQQTHHIQGGQGGQYYRSYDNSQYQQGQQQQQYPTFEPIPRSASQLASLNTPPPTSSSSSSNGLTSQFLESLLVQQMQRSQTPTQLSQSSLPNVNTNFPLFDTPPHSASTNATVGTNSPTSALLNNKNSTSHSAFSTSNNSNVTFDSFPSLQSQLSLNDLPLYGLPSVQTPLTSPGSSQFQPHQLMNFIFSDPSPSPTTVTPSMATRPGSVLRSTSENSSSTSHEVNNGSSTSGLVDPLESIWKRDSNTTSSNTSTVGMNQTIGDNVGSYF